MKAHIPIFVFALVALLTPNLFASEEFPPESEAWLSVHFQYPFAGKNAARMLHGRVGPGFELSKVDHAESGAFLLLLFPNWGEPKKTYLQHEALERFMRDWGRIALMRFDQTAFSKTEFKVLRGGKEEIGLLPFDSRTLIVSLRQDGKLTTLSIYAPDAYADAVKDRPEGKALREAMDLFLRVVGEVTL